MDQHLAVGWIRVWAPLKSTSPTDGERDLAVIRVDRDTPVSDIGESYDDLIGLTRSYLDSDGKKNDGPVFDVSVRLALTRTPFDPDK